MHPVTVRNLPEFDDWLERLKDEQGKSRILLRVRRLSLGNPGDHRGIGDGVSELRINTGPGYRVYYTKRTGVLVILLCGGDKSSQSKDIERAKALAAHLEEEST